MKPNPSPDDDLLRLELELMRAAMALTQEPVEARALVAQVLSKAREEPLRGRGDGERARLFRMLRQAYHSVVRTRTLRPPRDSQLNAMTAANQRAAVRTA
jgi:hypothetical protein